MAASRNLQQACGVEVGFRFSGGHDRQVCLFLQSAAEQEVVTGNVCSVVLLEMHGGRWGVGAEVRGPPAMPPPTGNLTLKGSHYPPKSLQSGMP